MTKSEKEDSEPQGKVYQVFDLCGEKMVRDSAWVADQYKTGMELVAEAVNKVREAKEAFELAQSITNDNADPKLDVDQAMIKLAECIGSAWQYYKEYLEETKRITNN